MVADIANLGAQSADYYLREVAEDELGIFQAERYFSGHGEAPGQWTGSAAERLGLSGRVSSEQFKAMFQGKDPTTGELLGRRHAVNGRPAFDLVLRPVKSVSILWALGDERVTKAVEGALQEGRSAALSVLEQEVGTRRGAGGKTRIDGQGLLVASFRHRQSRALDPLLHDHNIIANRIQGVDGSWTTIHGKELYHEALGADGVYQVIVRGALTRELGVEWERSERTGSWEIKGIPDQLIQEFSQRRAEIELAKEYRDAEGEGWSPKVAEFEAHRTRPEKEQVDEQTLRDRCAVRTEAAGFNVSELVSGVVRDGRTVERPTEQEKERLFGQMAAPDGLTEHKATFGVRDVRFAVHEAGVVTDKLADIEQLAGQFVRDGRVVPVLQDGKALYSTAELQATERELVDGAQRRQGDGVAVVRPEHVRDALAARPELGEDQAAMVRAICGDGNGVSVVVGRAGTGKTTALGVARDAWTREGIEVRGTAPTGIAATQMEESAGIEASTVDSLLLGLDAGRDQLPEGGVLVVDEAGMVGTRKLARVLAHAEEAGCKVVPAGDERQLQAIEAGGAFKALRQRLGGVELTVNRRQQSEIDKMGVELVRAGKGEEALQVYGAGGRVTWAKDQQTADAAMLRDWWASFKTGNSSVMLTLTRTDADRLNTAARTFRREAGHLGAEEIKVRGLGFAVGDLVVCRKNDRRATGAVNGLQARVEAFDPDKGTILVKTREGKHLTLTKAYLAKEGTGGGPALNHAYATTTHKTQAMTVDKGFLRIGGSETSEWSYVALSRVRQEARIYGVQPEIETSDGIEKYGERPTSRDQVAASMSRSGAEVLGVDQAQGRPLRHMSVGELREERDRLDEQLGKAPKSKAAEWRLLKERRDTAEEAFDKDPSGLNRKAADRAEERFRPVDDHERRRSGWHERMAGTKQRAGEVVGELGLRKLWGMRALQADPPEHLVKELGRPTVEWTAPARETWRKAAGAIESYRDRFKAYDQETALGQAPKDLGQRRAWNQTQDVVRGAKDAISGMFDKVKEAVGKGAEKGAEVAGNALERVRDLGIERK